MCDVIPYHSLRRLYVEVGGPRNFELLRQLLVFCPNLTELHVHFVQGTFVNALAQCKCLHDQLEQLETFTFTSEVPPYVPFRHAPDESPTFTNCAAVCANVRHDRVHDWWSCVELKQLVLGRDRPLILPSQLAAFVSSDSMPGKSEWEVSQRHSWARVRELCLLLLPGQPASVYPRALGSNRDYLQSMFLALDSITELNVSSFHFHLGVDLTGLFQGTPLGSRLLALSLPPCWFPRQSSVRTLLSSCPKLRDLDVRFVSRGSWTCASCHGLLNMRVSVQEPPSAATSSCTSVTRLALCDVPYPVLLSYFRYCGAVTTLRLAEWRCAEGLHFGHLFGLLEKFEAVRCLVLQRGDLPIDDQSLQDCLSRMPRLQHLCLLTWMKVLDSVASQSAHHFFAGSTQLKCVHMHHTNRSDGSERRLTWLKRGQDEVLLQEGPCFACCSTATFIGLVKPVNRDCEASMQA
nr:uncharacterized protein LOC119179799 [Rhipicephalus microplus]